MCVSEHGKLSFRVFQYPTTGSRASTGTGTLSLGLWLCSYSLCDAQPRMLYLVRVPWCTSTPKICNGVGYEMCPSESPPVFPRCLRIVYS